MSDRYWHANYWEPDYYSETWWPDDPGTDKIGQIAATVSLEGSGVNWWANQYWATQYWSSQYWGGATNTKFIGTFDVSGTRTGTIGVTLEPYPGAMTGPVVQVENLDFTLNIAEAWTIQEFPGFAGTISDTLAVSPMAAVGSFVAAGGATGTIAVTLASSPANFDGTHVAPANVIGTIGTTLGDGFADFVGQVFGVGTAIGTIAVTLEDSPTDFDGTLTAGTKTGTIAVTLDTSVAAWVGIFADADVVVGDMHVTLEDNPSVFTGTVVNLQELVVNVDCIFEASIEADARFQAVKTVKGRFR